MVNTVVDPGHYSGLARLFHWVTAVLVFALFALGYWMMTLGYYDPWYQRGPYWHISVGSLLAIWVVLRLLYRMLGNHPRPLPTHARWETRVAHVTHWALYALLMLIFFSGFLVVTEGGDPVPVFDWFHLPALPVDLGLSMDQAGNIHEWAAYVLMSLVALHIGGALKHHWLDKDATLVRMIRGSKP